MAGRASGIKLGMMGQRQGDPNEMATRLVSSAGIFIVGCYASFCRPPTVKKLRTAKCFKFKDILKDKCKLLDASSVTKKMKNDQFNMYFLTLLQTAMTDQPCKVGLILPKT